MRATALSLALIVAAFPVAAGGFVFDLPSLTWPEGDVTTSTKGCVAPAEPATTVQPACK